MPTYNSAKLIISAADSDPVELERRVHGSLAQRLAANPLYGATEIEKVTGKNHRLFPADFNLDTETCENLRVLTKLSQIELRPAHQITSHRKFIGPAIVFAKKLTWPIIRIHLKHTFDSMRELNSRMVQVIAKQAVEIERLKNR